LLLYKIKRMAWQPAGDDMAATQGQ